MIYNISSQLIICANNFGHERGIKVKTLKELYGETSRFEFIAWLLDILITFIICELLSNIDGPYYLEKLLQSHLTIFLGGVVYLWVVAVLINLPMLLTVGLSYGEYFAKLRLKEKFEIGSVYSLLRFSIRFFFGPSPKIANKLFGDKASIDIKNKKGKSLYVLYSLTVFSLALALISPMVRSLRYGGAIVNKEQKFINHEKLNDTKSLEKEYRLSSQRLHLITKLSTDFMNHWTLIPRFNLIKSAKKTIISSYLHVVDNKTFETGQLERSRKIGLAQLISNAFMTHNHLTSHNENLQEDILKKNNLSWSVSSREELKDLLLKSLSFGSSIKKHIISQVTNGPFVSGHLYLRSELKKIIPLTKIKSFSFIKLGQHPFIMFAGDFENKKRYSFFSLKEKRPYVYSLSWDGSFKNMNSFIGSFFNKVTWEFSDDTNFWSYPSKPTDVSVTHLMDMLIEKKLSKEHQNALEVSLYMYYFKLYKSALVSHSAFMLKMIPVEIKKIDRIVKLKKSNLTPVFIARWNSLVANTLSSNKKYFGVK